MGKKLKIILLAAGILLIISILLIIRFGTIEYGRVIAMDKDVKERWDQVDNQLKHRYVLTSELVNTIGGYANNESRLFKEINESIMSYSAVSLQNDIKDTIVTYNRLEDLLSKLLLLIEAYPTLKANNSFLKLIDSLEYTRNRVSVEIKRYNEAVHTINTYRKTALGNFFARIAKISDRNYYEMPEHVAVAQKSLEKEVATADNEGLKD